MGKRKKQQKALINLVIKVTIALAALITAIAELIKALR